MDITNAWNLIADKVESWFTVAIEMLPNLVVALLVIIAFYVLGRLIRRGVGSAMSTMTQRRTIINLLETVTGALVLGAGIFIALGILQLDGAVTTLLAGAGILVLALSFAFQDITANFISGVLLSIRQPFGIGDIVETNDFYGVVDELNLRNTILRTSQGQRVYIPNKSVFNNPLENYSQSGKRRIDLACGVSYGDDLRKARAIALEAIRGLEARDPDKDVELFYNEFGGSSVNFLVRFWIPFDANWQYASAQSEAIMALKEAFDANDIMIPYPIRTLDFGIRGGEKLDTMLGQRANGG